MRALVIGGSGFIGLNIVDALLAAGHDVRVTQRKHTVTLLLRKRGVELVPGSLDDEDSLAHAMVGCDAVFLAGAHYPRYSIDREATIAYGVSGVRNACRAALRTGVSRVIYTSSIASLGPPRNGTVADEDDVPSSPPSDSVYRSLKWAMEREIEAHVRRGLNAVTMLPGGCVGPWDLRVGTGALLVAAVRAELPWWVDGQVNIVDVGDVAQAHLRALESPAGSRYALGGTNITVGALLQRIVKRFGGSIPAEPLDPDRARARANAEEQIAAANRKRVAVPRELVDVITAGQPVSNARAMHELGIHFAPLDQTLDRAHEWFVRYRYLPVRDAGRPHETQ